MNDQLEDHGESGGLPLGIEVIAKAYAYRFDNPQNSEEDLINYQTFLEYTIINRSSEDYHDTYMSIWTDCDLGDYSDDYTGSDVKNNSYYFENGDDVDGDGNGNTYITGEFDGEDSM